MVNEKVLGSFNHVILTDILTVQICRDLFRNKNGAILNFEKCKKF